MNYKECTQNILEEIEKSVLSIDHESINHFAETIKTASRIFCDGKGRSGLQMKAFAMRLSQMGLSAFDAYGVTTPAITKGDLLIIASGSGETPNLLNHAQMCRSVGAQQLLLTTNPDSSLAQSSDYCIVFQAGNKMDNSQKYSIQPMGTLFEQSLEIFFDVLVLALMEQMNISDTDMYELHNNLE